MDSKSIGLCPQGLESPRCRLSWLDQASQPSMHTLQCCRDLFSLGRSAPQCRAACYTGAAQRNTQDAAQHTYGTMGQMARDRLVIRGLLCSAWRAVTIPIYARGAQVADNRALISGCGQLLSINYSR